MPTDPSKFVQGAQAIIKGLTGNRTARRGRMAEAKKKAKPAAVKIAESMKQIAKARADSKKLKAKKAKRDFDRATRPRLDQKSGGGARRGISPRI